jgi:hypothetical protein
MTTNTKTQHPYYQVLKWIANGETIQGFTKENYWITLTAEEAITHCAEYGNKHYFQPDELRLKPEPHVHQELITAWENGASIQYFEQIYGTWDDTIEPLWHSTTKYRIKSPDVVGYCNVGVYSNAPDNIDFGQCSDKLIPTDNLKVVFCGETLKLKSVEMIKGTDNDTI